MNYIEDFLNKIIKTITDSKNLFVTTLIILFCILAIELIILAIYSSSNIKKDTRTGKIICGSCNSTNLEFTEEIYKHVNPFIRLPFYLILVITVILFIAGLLRIALLLLTIVIFSFCMIRLFENFRSRRSHTKAICKDCGEIWYLQ